MTILGNHQCETSLLTIGKNIVELTRVDNRNPLVELVVIRHSVKLAAQHLSKGGLVVLAGFGVTRAVPLPFPGAVLTSKLWPVNDHMF